MGMSFNNLLVFAIVATATLYLIRRAYNIFASRKTTGCGTCGSCPANVAGEEKPQLVAIESLLAPPRKANTSR